MDFNWYQKELEKKEKRIGELETKYWETLLEYDKKLLDVEEKYIAQLKEKNEEGCGHTGTDS